MASLEVNIQSIEQQTIYGLWQKSNDKTVSKNIKALSEQYHTVVSIPEEKVLPYFVLFRNCNEQSRDFELFIGSVIDKVDLESLVLPTAEYAKITVKPNFIRQTTGRLRSSLSPGSFAVGMGFQTDAG